MGMGWVKTYFFATGGITIQPTILGIPEPYIFSSSLLPFLGRMMCLSGRKRAWEVELILGRVSWQRQWQCPVLLSYLNMTQILTIPPFCWLNQIPMCLTFQPPVFRGWNLHFHRVSPCFKTHRWDTRPGLPEPQTWNERGSWMRACWQAQSIAWRIRLSAF